MLERLPGELEREPLLRVHEARLAREDAEVLGVEAGDVLAKAAAGGRLADDRRVLEALAPVRRPALVRDLPDRVAAVGEEVPQRLRGVDPRREGAAHPNDRHRRPCACHVLFLVRSRGETGGPGATRYARRTRAAS